MALLSTKVNCGCCVFRAIPNCNHSLRRPYSYVPDDEELINLRDMTVNRKIYQFLSISSTIVK